MTSMRSIWLIALSAFFSSASFVILADTEVRDKEATCKDDTCEFNAHALTNDDYLAYTSNAQLNPPPGIRLNPTVLKTAKELLESVQSAVQKGESLDENLDWLIDNAIMYNRYMLYPAVYYLLDKGARSGKNLPSLLQAPGDFNDLLKLIVSYGIKNDEAVINAAERRNAEGVKILVDAGMNGKETVQKSLDKLETTLDSPYIGNIRNKKDLQNNYKAIFKTLIQNGAIPQDLYSLLSVADFDSIEALLNNPQHLDLFNNDNYLHMAVAYYEEAQARKDQEDLQSFYAIIKLLLEKGLRSQSDYNRAVKASLSPIVALFEESNR